MEFVLDLSLLGMNDCEIARRTGIPRRTVGDWRRHGGQHHGFGKNDDRSEEPDRQCPICGKGDLHREWYAYLLGMYLGDGCLSVHPRGVFRLRISLDVRYPGIIDECSRAVAAMHPAMKVGRVQRIGCADVAAYWKHWPCLFPQHGSGPKHLRTIALTSWQQEIADVYPGRLLRGLIHSDGCRGMNRVKGKEYPRYHFTNHSSEIRSIFCKACDRYGVAWRQMNWRTISVARRPDVAKLDLIIGPKT
ncbi:MAG: helix-turn-helix domain-containing protein [Actinomycetota bacterium]|nr:helix-turn-helix domain-containing protein [Actinomycetota bacterium]